MLFTQCTCGFYVILFWVQILSVRSDPSALESFLGLSAATAGEVSKFNFIHPDVLMDTK